MKRPSAAQRRAVVARAKRRCEYCGLAQAGQIASFHIDHVIPVVEGGPTHLRESRAGLRFVLAAQRRAPSCRRPGQWHRGADLSSANADVGGAFRVGWRARSRADHHRTCHHRIAPVEPRFRPRHPARRDSSPSPPAALRSGRLDSWLASAQASRQPRGSRCLKEGWLPAVLPSHTAARRDSRGPPREAILPARSALTGRVALRAQARFTRRPREPLAP